MDIRNNNVHWLVDSNDKTINYSTQNLRSVQIDTKYVEAKWPRLNNKIVISDHLRLGTDDWDTPDIKKIQTIKMN